MPYVATFPFPTSHNAIEVVMVSFNDLLTTIFSPTLGTFEGLFFGMRPDVPLEVICFGKRTAASHALSDLGCATVTLQGGTIDATGYYRKIRHSAASVANMWWLIDPGLTVEYCLFVDSSVANTTRAVWAVTSGVIRPQRWDLLLKERCWRVRPVNGIVGM